MGNDSHSVICFSRLYMRHKCLWDQEWFKDVSTRLLVRNLMLSYVSKPFVRKLFCFIMSWSWFCIRYYETYHIFSCSNLRNFPSKDILQHSEQKLWGFVVCVSVGTSNRCSFSCGIEMDFTILEQFLSPNYPKFSLGWICFYGCPN